MRRYLLLLLLGWLAGSAQAQPDPLIINVDGRRTTSLHGSWAVIVDPFDVGYRTYRNTPDPNGFFRHRRPQHPADRVEYSFEDAPRLEVPGDWNSQRPELFFYEGTVWYQRTFTYHLPADRRLFLYFGAANYEAVVALNGQVLGRHEGGFTPFNFEITELVRDGENDLVVYVNNRRRPEGVPTDNMDWWNYGGLTRRVLLVETPRTFVRDYFVQLDPADPSFLAGWVQLDGPERTLTVTLRLPELGLVQTIRPGTSGRGTFRLRVPERLERWSPEHPRRYRVELATRYETVVDSIGFRTIETRGTALLLNGRPIFLRGISIHEEAPFEGRRAFSEEDARVLLGWARELGCNFVRLAHYPHNEAMVRTAEAMGLLVWAEIPVYWTIQWENPHTLELARQQLRELITRDKNRAAVILWSVANETPRGEARLRFLRTLIDEARRLDPTRLVTAALEHRYVNDTTIVIDDELGAYLDVLGNNEYIGWYDGPPEKARRVVWRSAYDKPLIMSEWGGGAKAGLHGPAKQIWTEAYQARLYREQIAMLRRIPFVVGMSPWILKDFRSPRRPLARIQDYWNRKGVLSDRGQRKQAFYVLQAFYRELARSAATD
ncbi:Beta-glucuronidase [Rhodothermus marinus SG0.5JP17-172]|mgnify:FL=1|uniref:glycoside hydrolase family 2 protein n=1 Tax=Rhodothermus marinus TaxID=29549 RepID=UPI000223DA84|nr:glycoside hydrolase family 2 TIM barrel-domain containing protein [Rhodothermus marinus]AEN73543.1 Beta-glucuronidase [Rhodothermus marinus SG0.5JP17-172]